MKKAMKAIGITAALAVMIPLSAYAATNAGTNSTSSGTDGAAQTRPVDGDFGHRGLGHGRMGGMLSQDVLDLLKLDQATLQEKLSGGKTLAQVAEEQGVSRDALKQALTDAFTKKQEEQKQQFTDNLDNMVDGKFVEGFGRGFKMGITKDLSAIATVLGVTNDELKAALEGGKSPADLAKEKGVDVQKLIDAQKNAIAAQINQAVKDGKLTQEQADKQIANAGTIAEKIVNSAGFDRGFGGGRGHRFDAGGHTTDGTSQSSSQSSSQSTIESAT